MAEVYLAEQTSLSRFVAIKVLLPEMLKDSDGVPLKRFEQEARAAGAINHPNIVQVYSIGEQDGLHYIVQEFVEGMNLSEHVKRNGPPDAATGIKIMEHVATALNMARQAGIVHRDIKPENIMLTQDLSSSDPDITAKVADFGLAQLGQATEPLNLTQRGTTMGTPLYMSPEQINGQKLDGRSDLYSFGVTCYHMFAGRAPFRGETAMAVAAQHLQDTADPLSVRRPDLPKSVCGLIERMMNKAPEDRFQDAAALLDAILKAKTAIADGQPDMSLSAMGIPVRPKANEARSSKAKSILAFVGTCLAVGAVSAGVGYYMRPVDPLTVKPTVTDNSRDTRTAQYSFALANAESKAAWRALINHPEHGNDPLEGGWARIHLARIYLGEKRFDRADELFNEVEQHNSEPDLKAQGQIGLAATIFERQANSRPNSTRMAEAHLSASRMIEDIDEETVSGTAMRGWYFKIRSWRPPDEPNGNADN